MTEPHNHMSAGSESGRRPPRLETGRVCAICKKRTSPSGQKDTYGFKTILNRNGIAGDKAHRECVEALSEAPR